MILGDALGHAMRPTYQLAAHRNVQRFYHGPGGLIYVPTSDPIWVVKGSMMPDFNGTVDARLVLAVPFSLADIRRAIT